MIKRLALLVLMITVTLALTIGARGQEGTQNATHSETSGKNEKTSTAVQVQGTAAKYVPVEKYDPSRNAEQDVRDAMAEARRTGKRILLKVGGEWCIWCHIMDAFFDKHAELQALSVKGFVTLKINFSDENPNVQLLSRYPGINGYPHIFVLDRDGKLLQSQDTGELEDGKSYNPQKFMTFLKEWSPDTRVDASR